MITEVITIVPYDTVSESWWNQIITALQETPSTVGIDFDDVFCLLDQLIAEVLYNA